MKSLRVFQEVPTKKEPELFLRLVERDTGSINLVICNISGNKIVAGVILEITDRGIKLEDGLNAHAMQSLGLPMQGDTAKFC